MRIVRALPLATVVATAWLFPLETVQAQAKKSGPRHEQMDYGPFVSASIGEAKIKESADKKTGKKKVDVENEWYPKGNNANKGIAVQLNAEGTAGFCFDTDLCRMQSAWTGGFLYLRGTPFDGSHGSWPAPKGTILARTPVGPGWAKPGTDAELKDPRSEPYGPLPRDWAKYRGLYRHGGTVVFKYTVGEAEIHETPWAVGGAVCRTLLVGPTKIPLTLVAAEAGAAGKVGSQLPAGAKLEEATGGLLVRLPASEKAQTLTLVYGDAGAAAIQAPDVAALTKPAAAIWSQTVETKIETGKADGPYAVDNFPLPENNPWASWMRLGGVDFFKDGNRAAVSTWSGDVWIVTGLSSPDGKLVWKRYAAGLFQALGLRIVDDMVYVNGRDQITRLHDLNGDGEADFYECFNNDHATSTAFHEFVFDLQTDPEGNFYYSHGGGVNPGGRGFQPNPPASHHGCLIRVSRDGSSSEVWATGFRAPNGIGVGPKGEVTSGDNEGTWMPQCRLNLVPKGSFHGCVAMAHRATPPTDYDRPICWLPHGQVDNSGGGQTWTPHDKFGLPAGTLLHTSYGKSSLYHAVWETVDGVPQGGVVRVPANFLTGICRPRFHPVDGHLYVVGLRGWQTNGARDGAFHRVRFTGNPYVTVTGLHIKKEAIELVFNHPLDKATAEDVGNYGITQWNYLWSQAYGSARYSLTGSKGKDAADLVEISAAKLSPDGRTVTLTVPALRPVMQMNIKFKGKSADGSEVRLDLYNTINKIPGGEAIDNGAKR